MRKIFLGIAIVAVIGFLASSYYQFFYNKKNSFDESNTILKMDGPISSEVGESVDVEIFYQNNNKVNLKNATLTFNYPEEGFSDIKDNSGFGKSKGNSIVWEMGDVSAGYEGTIKISAKVMDISANKLSAKFDYEPDNFSSSFSRRAEYSFNVKPAKISLDLVAPKELVSNQELKYILTYTNATAIGFGVVHFKVNYPAGFVVSGSVPPATEENNIWEIQDLPRASSGQIEITGVLSGSENETKTVSAVAEQKNKEGKFILNNEANKETLLTSAPFVVVQTINDKETYSANAGETLKYKIKFRNLSAETESKIIVSAVLDGEAADYVYLEAENASVDREAHIITWDKKDKNDPISVKPQEEFEVGFNIRVKDKLPIVDFKSKNFVIKNTVTIKNGNIFNADGANKVIISSSFETKINSSVMLFTRGYFNDDGRLQTSGQVPPKVSQTTVYNIKWQILNTSNKIKNVKVSGVLPSNVRWTGNIFPLDGKIFYDINTRAVTWEAGDIEAATGFLSPLKEIIFQLSITPAIEDVGKYLILIDQNNLTATDEFTLSEVSVSSDGITTRLPDDISIGEEQGKVVP